MALPYPIPDPATGDWDPFALKRNLEYLDTNRNRNTSTTIARALGNPYYTSGDDTSEDTIFSTTIEEGILHTTGIVRFVQLCDLANLAGASRTFTFRFYFGGTKFAELVQTCAVDAQRYRGQVLGWIAAAGSTQAQVGLANLQFTATGVADGADPAGSSGGRISGHTALTINAETGQTLLFTMQKSGGTAANVHARFFAFSVETY